jgi:hypothetical protein
LARAACSVNSSRFGPFPFPSAWAAEKEWQNPQLRERKRSGRGCPPRPSKHLRLLKEAGVLAATREGYYVLYSLVPECLASVSPALSAFLRALQ